MKKTDSRAPKGAQSPEAPYRSSLPVPLTPLVGRVQLIAEVKESLWRADVRLVTLTGIGGVGKTRLALKIASDLVKDFPDGVTMVPLADLRDPALLPDVIAAALGLRGSSIHTPLDLIKQQLYDEQALLVLDNFEHLLPAAVILHEILASTTHLKVLITSRSALRLTGEYEYLVSPLAVPRADAQVTHEGLAQCEAAVLFVQRAQAVDARFSLTSENAHVIASICRRLDGLPLALELAAARVKLFTPKLLLERLEHCLTFLTNGARELPARHQTLTATLDWSYDLLSVPQQNFVRRMAVYVGGCTLEALEALMPSGDTTLLLEHLGALVEHSLVIRMDNAPEPARFGMLETVREYALAKLHAAEEDAQVKSEHARYYLWLVEETAAKLEGAEQKRSMDLLKREHDNVRAAITWALEQHDSAIALNMVGNLCRYWDMHGHYGEAMSFLKRALQLPYGAEHRQGRAKVLLGAGVMAMRQGSLEVAERYMKEGADLNRELGDKVGYANALHNLASVTSETGRYENSMVLLEEVVLIRRELGDTVGLARALHNLGVFAFYQDDFTGVLAYYAQSLPLFRQLGNQQGVAWSLDLTAWAHYYLKNPALARRYFMESLVLSRDLGDTFIIFDILQGLADTLLLEGKRATAVQYLAASEAMRLSIGATRSLHCENAFVRLKRSLEATLDEATFQAAWLQGQTATLDALTSALERCSGSIKSKPNDSGQFAGLTPREHEVLALVALGMSDRKIAKQLGISPTTVSKHVANILAKTELKNRTILATWAHAQGLAQS